MESEGYDWMMKDEGLPPCHDYRCNGSGKVCTPVEMMKVREKTLEEGCWLDLALVPAGFKPERS